MTEYTEDLCNGGIASANYAWSTWVAANAFDNNESTGWHFIGTLPAKLTYQFTQPYKICKYTLKNRNSSVDNYQVPSHWDLLGSNNATDWTILDTHNDVYWTHGLPKKEFTFINNNNYLYYRLNVRAWYDGAISIMEMEMMEEVHTVPVSTIYSVGHRGNLRGKANQGYIRPTIKQFFMSIPDWKDVLSGYRAKSVIFDINGRYGGTNYGIRTIGFYNKENQIELVDNYTAYQSSTFSTGYAASYVFNSNSTKIGQAFYNGWASVQTTNPQRLIVVFDDIITFNKMIVNNYHNGGSLSEIGLKDVKITVTTDTITSTTPNTSVQNGIVIFDDIFEKHTGINEVQDWEVPLISLSV